MYRYKCTSKTQLQWQVEAVTPCQNFPLGVKTMYRRASAESIIEVIEHVGAKCGIYPQRADVFWFPQKNEADGVEVDGMYLLQSLPNHFPDPNPFPDNSLYQLQELLPKIHSKFVVNNKTVVDQWFEFANSAPQTNDVRKHVLDNPLHYPLGTHLFSDVPLDATPIAESQNVEDDIKRVRCTDCVQWSRRGVHRPAAHSENCPRLETAYDAAGNPIMIDAMPKKVRINSFKMFLMSVV